MTPRIRGLALACLAVFGVLDPAAGQAQLPPALETGGSRRPAVVPLGDPQAPTPDSSWLRRTESAASGGASLSNAVGVGSAEGDTAGQVRPASGGDSGMVTRAAAREPDSAWPAEASPQHSASPQDPPAGQRRATPLAPPSDRTTATTGSGGGLQALFTVGSSLMIVLGLFFGVAWCYKRGMRGVAAGHLPKQVLEVLGRSSLGPRQHLVLLRVGPKLVLVSVIQGEARTLTEITDPLEVDRMVGECESIRPGSVTQSFREILSQGGAA